MKSNNPKNITIWTGFFFYTLIIGLIIQLFLLPFVFPSWNAGDGLLKGLDTEDFHGQVLEQLKKIEVDGWQAWSPKPNGQTVVGVAVLFYGLISPHPWSMLPFNAILHATAGLSIFLILLTFTKDQKKALIATLPFVFFPTALSWTAQYHNDNFMVTGVALFVLGWVQFSNYENWGNWKKIGLAVLNIIIGSVLIWFVRLYVLSILDKLGLIVGIFLSIYAVVLVFRNREKTKQAILAIIIIWTTLGASELMLSVRLEKDELKFRFLPQLSNSGGLVENDDNTITNNYHWTRTNWLPKSIDSKISSLIRTRRSGYKPQAGSNLDYDIKFSNAVDVIMYLPRAVEIGFLAPFPNQWLANSKKEPNTIMRKLAGLEMLMVYFSWVGTLYAIWKWRKMPGLWVFLLFNTSMMIIYALAVMNIGTLHRFRYAFMMPLVGLGVLGWFELLKIYLPNVNKLTMEKVN